MNKLFDMDIYKKFGDPVSIDNRFFVSKNYGFIYAEIPKVGISTTKKTLAECITGNKVSYNVHNREQFILKTPDFYSIKYPDFNNYYKFTFVRNPYTRILSGYIDKVVNNPGEELKQLLNFSKLPSNYIPTFYEFLKILEVIEPKRIDSHFCPQYILLCMPVISYDFIGRFESFELDLNTVIKKLLSDKDCKYLRIVNHHKTNASDINVLSKYYNEQTIDLVKKIYAQDFLYFNYPFNINHILKTNDI